MLPWLSNCNRPPPVPYTIISTLLSAGSSFRMKPGEETSAGVLDCRPIPVTNTSPALPRAMPVICVTSSDGTYVAHVTAPAGFSFATKPCNCPGAGLAACNDPAVVGKSLDCVFPVMYADPSAASASPVAWSCCEPASVVKQMSFETSC